MLHARNETFPHSLSDCSCSWKSFMRNHLFSERMENLHSRREKDVVVAVNVEEAAVHETTRRVDTSRLSQGSADPRVVRGQTITHCSHDMVIRYHHCIAIRFFHISSCTCAEIVEGAEGEHSCQEGHGIEVRTVAEKHCEALQLERIAHRDEHVASTLQFVRGEDARVDCVPPFAHERNSDGRIAVVSGPPLT